MLRKNIRYTKHAVQRKLERGITDEQISIALENPDYTVFREGRKVAVKRFGQRIIKVVHKEEETHILVITVY
jgi:SOS response regulatory protein OraA/RecX